MSRMSSYGDTVGRLIEQFAHLPGIGKKSAERLTYHILRVPKAEALALAEAIRDVRQNVHYCRRCFHLTESEECEICRDPRRDSHVLCVVEQPRDLMALEQTGTYRGRYHVLLGRIAPLDGVGPDQLTIRALVDRVRAGVTPPSANGSRHNGIGEPAESRLSAEPHVPTEPRIEEVIMATNPNVEGDGTALYISNLLADLPVKVTRLARGITTGSVLEFANKEILTDALSGRQAF